MHASSRCARFPHEGPARLSLQRLNVRRWRPPTVVGTRRGLPDAKTESVQIWMRGEGERLRLGAAKQPGGARDAGFVFVFAGAAAAAATAAATIFTIICAVTSAMGAAAAEAGLILVVFIGGRAVRGDGACGVLGN